MYVTYFKVYFYIHLFYIFSNLIPFFSSLTFGLFKSISMSACSVSSVQSLSHVRLFVTPCTAACQGSLSIINSQSLLKLMSIESVMALNHLTLCHHLFFLISICPTITIFSNESVLCIRWPKYCSFNFSISPSNEYSGLISFRVWSPCSPRDSQESSLTPQFKIINSSAFSLCCGPTLTSTLDYWKKHRQGRPL